MHLINVHFKRRTFDRSHLMHVNVFHENVVQRAIQLVETFPNILEVMHRLYKES